MRQKNGMNKICPICKKVFYVKKSHTSWRKYCSRKCKETKGLCKANSGSFNNRDYKGKNHWHWKGGKCFDKSGYVMIHKPKHPFSDRHGYIREHRLVVEKQIGRHLTPKEKCHHLGEKDDNRPHMLMAFINDSAHMRFHKNPQNVKPEEIIFDGRSLI